MRFMEFMASEWLGWLSGMACGRVRLETGEMAWLVEPPGLWPGRFEDLLIQRFRIADYLAVRSEYLSNIDLSQNDLRFEVSF